MSLQPPNPNTKARGGLQAGTTAGRKSGQYGTKTRNRNTAGVTTTGTGKEEDLEYVTWQGQRIYVKPTPLMMKRDKDASRPMPGDDMLPGADNMSQAADSQKSKDISGDDAKGGSKNKEQEEKKKESSVHSQLSSSLMDTSQDEQAKKEAEKAAKQAKKGLSKEELEAEIEVVLKETETVTLMFFPGVVINHDTDENTQTIKDNKEYEVLRQSKIGSDSFTARGTQTLNPTQKVKNEQFIGCTQESKEITASTWDIDDASKMVRLTEAKQQEINYLKSIDDIMANKLKDKRSLFDAEALASHISIASTTTGDLSKSKNTNTKSKMKSSQSGLRESKNSESQSSVSGSKGFTQSGVRDTTDPTSQAGDFAEVKSKDIKYVDEELPASMAFCLRIIVRLLTQSQYHEQHVLYRNYPPVDLERAVDEEEKADDGQNPLGFGFGGDKKKDEEDKKEEVEENIEESDDVSITHLFKFRCPITDGRQVTCIDINSVNEDLIAVSYGEYDINCTKKLNQGLLAFWTLKNPTYPELLIHHDYSITSCQFSKKDPYLIAIGDSQGNVAIFNIRSTDRKPIADSMDLDGKHTDIVWEVQWVDREAKGEALISVGGDGRVIEWSMRKGLEFSDLTQLKRETNSSQEDPFGSAAVDEKDKKGGMTFINTGGLSIDFPRGGHGITYFAATEDCCIYNCQTSYPDQSMMNYYGHQGPIYRVRCNPFWHSQDCPIFLTCSYDWTVRVWNSKEQFAKLICQQQSDGIEIQAQVNDITWSPITSTVFSSVADDGRVEIWDIKLNSLKPLVTYFDKFGPPDEEVVDHTPKTVVRFSQQYPVMVTGNQKGEVDVYRTRNLEHDKVTDQDQQKRLLSSLKKDDFSGKDDKAGE